jgi:hypothetical protein
MVQNWAFAADLLASKVSGEFAALFGRALDARLNWSSTTRSINEQWVDVMASGVASQQHQSMQT